MAKNENAQSDPYIVEDVKQTSKLRGWISSRPAKITAIAVGSALALGTAFTGGALAGRELIGGHDGPRFAKDFDRDADHRSPLDGPRPPKPGHGPDGDRDGQFKMDGTQPPAPTSTSTPSTTTP